MANYIHLFIRSKSDDFICIGSYCQSSVVYEVLHPLAPWEKISPVEAEDLDLSITRCTNKIGKIKSSADRYMHMIDEIRKCEAPLRDKIEEISDYYDSLSDLYDEENEVDSALNEIKVFRGMIENEDVLLYAGCECGSEVTSADIIAYEEDDNTDYPIG